MIVAYEPWEDVWLCPSCVPDDVPPENGWTRAELVADFGGEDFRCFECGAVLSTTASDQQRPSTED